MIQDLIVYIIIILVAVKTGYTILKFFHPGKTKTRPVCNGCKGCSSAKPKYRIS